MHAAAFGEVGSEPSAARPPAVVLTGAGVPAGAVAFPGAVGFVGTDEFSGDDWGFPSSLRHMGAPRLRMEFLEVAFRGLGKEGDLESLT